MEMTMGKRIMTLRKQKNLTQEQLAEKLNVSPQAVSKWENDISCPDISLVPALAGVLGVSSDILLGMAPMAEPEPIPVEAREEAATAEGEGERKPWSWEFEAGKFEKGGGTGIALLFILVGALFLASRAGLLPFGQPTLWGIIWPCVLLGLGVGSAVKERSPLGLGIGLLGLYYLLYNLGAVTAKLSWGDIWPILLILLGLNILTEKLWPKKRTGAVKRESVRSFTDADGVIYSACNFGKDTNLFAGEIFRGGKLELAFGRGELDLTRATGVAEGAELELDLAFGSLELILPKTIRLETDCERSFSSVKIIGNPDPATTQILRLTGDVAFALLEISYQ